MSDSGFVTCGTCYVYVRPTSSGECSFCHGPLNPTNRQILHQFIDKGIDPRNGGVPLPKVQAAVAALLRELEDES